MYFINKGKNQIEKIAEKKLGELGFREREHLQEWIAKTPSCLGEDLLIIQKEFDVTCLGIPSITCFLV